MKLTAVYVVGRNIKYTINDYFSSKREFAKSLRENGFRVRKIFTEIELQKLSNEKESCIDKPYVQFIKDKLKTGEIKV